MTQNRPIAPTKVHLRGHSPKDSAAGKAMNLKTLVCVIATGVALAGCAEGGMSHQDSGTLVGAVAGGLIGNQFGHGAGRAVATATGVIVGGIIGSEIGRSLDEEDRRYAAEAEYEALQDDEIDHPRKWRNPKNGRYGTVTARRPYRHAGMTCREFEHDIYINGRPETMTGKACRQPDGTWKQV
jgi:surface antigen